MKSKAIYTIYLSENSPSRVGHLEQTTYTTEKEAIRALGTNPDMVLYNTSDETSVCNNEGDEIALVVKTVR